MSPVASLIFNKGRLTRARRLAPPPPTEAAESAARPPTRSSWSQDLKAALRNIHLVSNYHPEPHFLCTHLGSNDLACGL